ncbi:MAG: phage tail protein [Ezakiella sp.]|nr:phage tail protein [Ezakiella sp.]
MNINQFYLTNKGRHLLAKVQAGETLSFTKVGIGKGEPVSAEYMENMTALLEPKNYFPVTEVRDNKDGTVSIGAVLNNADVEERYFIKEIGIYARDPEEGEILYAVTSCGDASDLFSAKTDKELNLVLEIRVTIGNAKNVTFIIDDSLVWATKQELYNLAGIGRTDESVKKNADDILAIKLQMMMMNTKGEMGNIDENSVLVTFKDLKESENFWGFWEKEKSRLVG